MTWGYPCEEVDAWLYTSAATLTCVSIFINLYMFDWIMRLKYYTILTMCIAFININLLVHTEPIKYIAFQENSYKYFILLQK